MATDRLIITRRGFGIGLVGGAASLTLPAFPAAALTVDEAKALVGKAVADVNRTINSGKTAQQMYPDFERIFATYADVPVIARSALGIAARRASSAQMAAFTKAFQTYISHKYGRRFRDFIGSEIVVTDARPIKTYFEVLSVARLKGQEPFDLRWHVSDKSGKHLFFNIIIEGVNLLSSERAEIGAMLDKRKGDLNALIEDLKRS